MEGEGNPYWIHQAMTPEEAIKRAGRAQQLLEEPMIKEALETIERDIIAQWEACPARDTEGREQLWKYYKTALKFKGILQGAIESGKLEQLRQVSLREKVHNFVRK